MSNEVKYPDVTVELVESNGNAWAILGAVSKALRKAGHGDAVKAYQKESVSGDYDHLLQTAMSYVEVL